MSWKSLVCAGLVCVLTSPVMAAPVIQVTDGGLNGGNQVWNVAIGPDVATFTANTSLAAEIDFEFTGTILSAALNETFWNVGIVDNAGNNPFTGTVTEGVWDDGFAEGELFVAAGSELFANSTPVNFLTITTQGAGGTLSWGGNAVTPAGGGAAYTSTRIAQEGVNFDGISGNLVIGGGVQAGDFNGNGTVENADLTLLLNNWGAAVPPVPAGWTGDQPTTPAIDNSELTALLNNWGAGAGSGALVSGGAVPEPTSIALIGLALGSFAMLRRRAA